MRRFEATPQKKFLGMVILFVFVPLFLVWYWVFFLGHRPGADTMVIIAACLLLAAYFYLKNRQMVNGFVFGKKEPVDVPEEEYLEDDGSEGELDNDSEDLEDDGSEGEEFEDDEQELKS